MAGTISASSGIDPAPPPPPAMTAPGPITIDARGHRCPVPTLRLRRAVEGARAGDRFRLLCDDPLARIDVPHFAAEAGLIVLEAEESGDGLGFLLEAR